ncbi:ABC transporter permease [Phycicoccus sp. BSK3Z-2]|uniref:ABC transporter permease n=1 Tax=Phycicoccus avicenniae TaxID=2828860 RepID=A0A941HZ94_9MICO|nr:ABC transporter permease [Phycicoccus avicenniae]MBR7742685.1 ABC transporter permease [Phycicoccus avicenniae]
MSTTDLDNAAAPPAARRFTVPVSLARYGAALRTPRGMIAAGILLALTAIALLAPVIFPQGYDVQSRDRFLGMSTQHLFGTDEYGRDIFVRTVYGLRTDLALVAIAVPVSGVIGSLLGLSGAVWPRFGNLMQRVFDVIIGFPSFILALCVVVVMGVGFASTVVAITILGLPGFGRLARSGALEQQNREYVVAARTLGVSRRRILTRHIVPNTADPLIVHGAIFAVNAVFIESGLGILGLGVQPPQPSLGSLLNVGMRYVREAPTYPVGPILVLLLLALALSMLSDSLNERVNRR